MSEPPRTPPPSPAHLHPTTVEIPAIWTPEQALAVFDLLDELKEKIWGLYSCQLQDLLQEQQRSSGLDDDKGSATSGHQRDF
jgi:hypothetical protein